MWPKNVNMRVLATTALALGLVLLAGCSSGSSDAGGKGAETGAKADKAQPKKVIKMADVQWQSNWINNAIAGFILEEGYGYPTETVEMTTPIMQQAIVKGDIDLMTEMWRSNLGEWYDKVIQEKKVLELGPTFEKATQGWYVPRYMVEGDAARNIKATAPDLKSVADLKKYKNLLQDPEEPGKGLLINCITGWECAKVNRVKLQAYGLAGDFNVLEPGASAALDAAIAGAYKKGNPFLAYYWEPTWLVGTYDLVQLEEPAWNAQCQTNIKSVLEDKVAIKDVTATYGCGYPEEEITKAIHPSLKERAPEVVDFLQKMNVGTDPLNKTSAYMEANKVDAQKAAIWFFENYQDRWKTWVPADVQAKLVKALREAGAKL